MVLPDGRPKGMKMVLRERGVNTNGMNAEKMWEPCLSTLTLQTAIEASVKSEVIAFSVQRRRVEGVL